MEVPNGFVCALAPLDQSSGLKDEGLYSAVPSPQHNSKLSTRYSMQDCSIQQNSDLFRKHTATLQVIREGCSYTHPPLCIARYSFIHLSEPERLRVDKLA